MKVKEFEPGMVYFDQDNDNLDSVSLDAVVGFDGDMIEIISIYSNDASFCLDRICSVGKTCIPESGIISNFNWSTIALFESIFGDNMLIADEGGIYNGNIEHYDKAVQLVNKYYGLK